MTTEMLEKWNNNTDLKGLQEDVKEAAKNDNENFEKLPYDEYEVKIDKIELAETKTRKPKAVVWFTILNGKYKNNKLFMNQVIEKGIQIHIMNQFLRSLDTGIEVEFADYIQYADLLLDIAEACDEQKLEYALKYEDNKGYDKFTIKEVFEG